MKEPGCWPRLLVGPGEGFLNAEELSQVISILAAATGKHDHFFRFSEISFIATDKPILFIGSFDELPSFLTKGHYQLTPEYWWPSDQSWCLCSDFDLDYTFVGGSRSLISELVKNPSLEVFQVTAETRLDNAVPIPKRGS